MNALERVLPAPIPTQDSQPFWDAAKEGRFLIKRCANCGKAHWYPRPLCPFCLSDDMVWLDSAGTGVIYTFSVMVRAAAPFVLAFVTLDEGPTLLSNLVNCEPGALAIGQPVRVLFRASDGEYPVPVFEPASNRQTTLPRAIADSALRAADDQ